MRKQGSELYMINRVVSVLLILLIAGGFFLTVAHLV